MATVVTDDSAHVEGQFNCPRCGATIISGAANCRKCGSPYEKKDAAQSAPTDIVQDAERQHHSDAQQVWCSYCSRHTDAIEAEEGGLKCKSCGGPIELSHPVPPVAKPAPASVENTGSEPIFRYQTGSAWPRYLVAGAVMLAAFFLVAWGIWFLVGKASERHPTTVTVSGHSWQTSIETLKPFAHEEVSDHPMSGDNITPGPVVTKKVGEIANPLPTRVEISHEPGEEIVTYGQKYRCPESVATPTRLDDGSFKVPLCQDETRVPGPTQEIRHYIRPMGTPTPVWGTEYQYVRTGFEAGMPLQSSGQGGNVQCPNTAALPQGWKLNGSCQKSFSISLSLPTGGSISRQVSEAQYNSLRDGQTIAGQLDGFGNLVEIQLP